MDSEQNELESIFEEELSNGGSDNSFFSNELNFPLKKSRFGR
jgi:hypothetical protein